MAPKMSLARPRSALSKVYRQASCRTLSSGRRRALNPTLSLLITMTTAELHRKGVTTNMRCARCYAVAVRDGETTWRHGDGKGGPRYVDGDNVPQSVRKMPNGDNVPQSVIACSACKVRLCKACFRMELDDGKPHPGAWDHKA